jgi:hypothetical protein
MGVKMPKATVKVKTEVKRGPESWSYIYVTLGFVLTIEATIITMIEPLKFPWNIVAYLIFAAFTIWQFLDNGRLQNKDGRTGTKTSLAKISQPCRIAKRSQIAVNVKIPREKR